MAKKKGRKLIHVDFTGVEVGGGGRVLPEGPVQLEVTDVEQKEGEDSGKPYLEVKFKALEHDDAPVWDNLSLQPQALWKLRTLMEAGGLQTEAGPMDIDPDELIGLVVTANLIHDEYKGRTKNRIDGYVTEEPEQAADETGRRPVKKKAAKEANGEWKVKQRVKFMDGKNELEGVITKIDGDKVDVRVGRDEYEMRTDDLEAA